MWNNYQTLRAVHRPRAPLFGQASAIADEPKRERQAINLRDSALTIGRRLTTKKRIPHPLRSAAVWSFRASLARPPRRLYHSPYRRLSRFPLLSTQYRTLHKPRPS